jgi:hypothetical protein
MFFGIFILLRVLFAASRVFIIGYIFGGFSKKPVLRTLAKIAAILVILLFIITNVVLMRTAIRQGHGPWCRDRQANTLHP